MARADPDPLAFGTDGWRAVIGDEFTFANVRRAARAYAGHLRARGGARVLVGFDTRFNASAFARCAAEQLAADGLEVKLATAPLPTPALSFAVKHDRADGGVMLTASHNPPEYLGFKLKGPYGGSATPDVYRDVEARCAELPPLASPGNVAVETFDVREAYFQALTNLVELDTLRTLEGTLIHDAMGGAAGGWLKGFARFAGLKINVVDHRAKPDPMFYGVSPEPIPANLDSDIVRQHSDVLFMVSNDGDGDRLAVALADGRYFNAHQIFAVLLDHLDRRGLRGGVAKTFSVSRIIERLAHARGWTVYETPIGFKYLVEAMLAGKVILAGEESGGIGVVHHLPERDGLACTLLLLEAVAGSGEGLAERFAAIERETAWPHAYQRIDRHVSNPKAVVARLIEMPPSACGRRVVSVETLDGCKLNLEGGAWVLFRASGTEPLLRLYGEAPSEREVATILAAAERLVMGLSPAPASPLE